MPPPGFQYPQENYSPTWYTPPPVQSQPWVRDEKEFKRIFRGLVDTYEQQGSVAVTRAGVFANLWNKIGKILKIFERLDHLRSQWVLCQL
jgi:hypothetical protein